MSKGVIYCPSCYRKLGTCSERATIPLVIDCKECKKRIVYNPVTGSREIKPIPQRNLASGKTFY